MNRVTETGEQEAVIEYCAWKRRKYERFNRAKIWEAYRHSFL